MIKSNNFPLQCKTGIQRNADLRNSQLTLHLLHNTKVLIIIIELTLITKLTFLQKNVGAQVEIIA